MFLALIPACVGPGGWVGKPGPYAWLCLGDCATPYATPSFGDNCDVCHFGKLGSGERDSTPSLVVRAITWGSDEGDGILGWCPECGGVSAGGAGPGLCLSLALRASG